MFSLLSLVPLLALVSGQSCPSNPPQSCTTASIGTNSCCTNAPNGAFLQTQFWDTAERINSFTMHGLWVTFDSFCDDSRNVNNVDAILANSNDPGARPALDYMNQYWPSNSGTDNSFWSYEFNKHATCISTLRPSCYGSDYINKEDVVDFFKTTVAIFQALPTLQWLQADGIYPSTTRTYTLNQLQAVAQKNTGRTAVWNCQNGAISDVYWGFTTTGGFAGGNQQFQFANALGSSNCPSSGIKFLPKN